jgi:hypothetical protein
MTTQAKRWEPTSEQATHLLGFSQNSEFYTKNIERMKKQNAGKFVAILDSNVILSDDDAKKLLDLLRNKFSKKELSQVFITYVPTEREIRIA